MRSFLAAPLFWILVSLWQPSAVATALLKVAQQTGEPKEVLPVQHLRDETGSDRNWQNSKLKQHSTKGRSQSTSALAVSIGSHGQTDTAKLGGSPNMASLLTGSSKSLTDGGLQQVHSQTSKNVVAIAVPICIAVALFVCVCGIGFWWARPRHTTLRTSQVYHPIAGDPWLTSQGSAKGGRASAVESPDQQASLPVDSAPADVTKSL